MPTPDHYADGVRRLRRLHLLHRVRPSLHDWREERRSGVVAYLRCHCTATRPLPSGPRRARPTGRDLLARIGASRAT